VTGYKIYGQMNEKNWKDGKSKPMSFAGPLPFWQRTKTCEWNE